MNKYILYCILIISLLIIPKFIWARREIPDNNLDYPVLITLSNKYTGSGFFLLSKNIVYFVTARHVLFSDLPKQIYKKYLLPKDKILPNNIDKISYDNYNKSIIFNGRMTEDELRTLIDWATDIELKNIIQEIYNETQFKLISDSAELLYYSNNNQKVIDINLLNLFNSKKLKYSDSCDIAVAEIVQFANETTIVWNTKNVSIKNIEPDIKKASAVTKYDSILVSNEIYVFGYPTSLGLKDLPQLDKKKPLLRKGIIAGKNDKLKTIIIDCPIYYGNSGGPVIQIEDVDASMKVFTVIGIISEFVPFVEELHSSKYGYTNTNISNSGYAIVVPIDFILELIESK
ncbi:MAG: trypsin-like peptidase domain-containing protein [bacterium]|nr:trypsin-like peptidase domain-containing protein [bacterium]